LEQRKHALLYSQVKWILRLSLVLGSVLSAEDAWWIVFSEAKLPGEQTVAREATLCTKLGRAAAFHSFFLQHNKIQQP
jgi:hypothetical protein